MFPFRVSSAKQKQTALPKSPAYVIRLVAFIKIEQVFLMYSGCLKEKKKGWRDDIKKLIKERTQLQTTGMRPRWKHVIGLTSLRTEVEPAGPWLMNAPCCLPYLNPRPGYISQEQIERGNDTGLTIKPKVIRNRWKMLHKKTVGQTHSIHPMDATRRRTEPVVDCFPEALLWIYSVARVQILINNTSTSGR